MIEIRTQSALISGDHNFLQLTLHGFSTMVVFSQTILEYRKSALVLFFSSIQVAHRLQDPSYLPILLTWIATSKPSSWPQAPQIPPLSPGASNSGSPSGDDAHPFDLSEQDS